MKTKAIINIFTLIFVFLLVTSYAYADTTDDDEIPETSNIDAPNEDLIPEEGESVNISPDREDYYDEDITDDNSDIINPFDIKLTLGTQNPFTKRIPIWIVVTPNINAERAEVTWDSRYGLEFISKYDQFLKLNKGESYTLKTVIDPQDPGSYTLTVNVNEWGYGKNYASSEKFPIVIDDNLVVDPVTDGYGTALIIMYIIIALVSIAFLTILIFGGKKVLKWLKEWLKPPEF